MLRVTCDVCNVTTLPGNDDTSLPVIDDTKNMLPPKYFKRKGGYTNVTNSHIHTKHTVYTFLIL